jgi:RimJ/RimL family protein N-acetyltransferase
MVGGREVILETERLIVRNWRPSDVHCYMTLSKDVGYHCFSRPGFFLVHSVEEAQDKIRERIDFFNERGLGKFPVFRKDTGEFIGTCGLGIFDVDGAGEVEVGYRLCLKHWGHGYATESAVAVLRYGFVERKLETIRAIALPQNAASLRILEKKLGARYLRDFVYADMPHRLYDIPREKFAG